MRRFIGRQLRRLSTFFLALANKIDPVPTPYEMGKVIGVAFRRVVQNIEEMGKGMAEGMKHE